MHHHVILRRDSAIDSLTDHYRRRFENSDDVSESGSEASPQAPNAMVLPFNAKECDIISQQIDEEKTSTIILTKENFKPKFSKQKSTIITLSIVFICFAATAIGTLTYGKQRILLNNISFYSNYAEKNKNNNFSNTYPESFSVFASKFDEHSSDDVPVFLDLAGTESDFVPLALSRCLNLSKDSILERKKRKKMSERNTDFIYTDSLCAFSTRFKQNKKARVFMLVRNPTARSILSFGEKQDINGAQFDERTLGLELMKYVKTSLSERDFLTRSILCKENSELKDEDYAAAKFFLDNYVTYGVFKDSKIAFVKFLEAFNWKFQSTKAKKCVDNVLKRGLMQKGKYADIGMDMAELYDELKAENKYDTKLYSHAVSKA